MFSHVMVGTNDIEVSKQFYDAILSALGCPGGVIDDKGRCFYMTKTGVFGVTKPIDGNAASCANGGTIGFAAKSEAEVDEWHKAGLANGGAECEDPPGVRENAFGNLYVAYLRDPDGNKVCALYRAGQR